MSTLVTAAPVSLRALLSAVSGTIDHAFEEHCRRRFRKQAELLMAVVLACNVIWWPVDWLVFSSFPESIPVLGRCRAALTILTLFYLLICRLRIFMPLLFWVFAMVAAGCCFASGATAAALGGPDAPPFHALYVVIFGTVPLPLTMPRRLFATCLLALATGLGLFVMNPAHIHATYAPLCISFLVFTFVVSAWFGHSQFVLTRANFHQAAELAEHGRLLETRVAERTIELRTLLDHLETAREMERTRISRELHDELGQELSALRFSLGLTKMRYTKEPLSVTANLEELEDLLRRTAQTTRNLVTDLRPRVIDDLGLGAAVEWLVKRTEQRTGLACRLSIAGELAALDERVAIAAFRILQEALTNVVRHAQATEVTMEVRADDVFVFLCVTDDGVGIEASREQANNEESSGVGLLGMRERAMALGGELGVGKAKGGRGTEVRCRLPRMPVSARAERRSGSGGRV